MSGETIITEGCLQFTFPSDQCLKLDATSFYRHHYLKETDARCVDFVFVDDTQVLWLLEVKDYRPEKGNKDHSNLGKILIEKFTNSLSILFCLAKAPCSNEKDLAEKTLHAKSIICVLHIEGNCKLQKGKLNALQEDAIKIFSGNLKVKLRSLNLKFQLSSREMPGDVKWKVASLPFSVKEMPAENSPVSTSDSAEPKKKKKCRSKQPPHRA